MARRDTKADQVSDGPVLGPVNDADDGNYGAGEPVEATREPEEVENGTLGQEGSTGASKEESEKAGNFGLGFTEGYEDPILLTPPQTAGAEETTKQGYEH